ncbi:MAG: response regulator [Silvanigrellaceae bacterium]|nr:response regulator [Silvanigrellaceae bacterium]
MSEDLSKDQKYTIIYVEEDPKMRAFVSGVLSKSMNYIAKNTSSAKEALDVLKQESKETRLVIFNWDMTDIPGPIFLQKIRNNADYDHIEILLCSDQFDEQDYFLIEEMDIQYITPKINNANDLMKKIEEIDNLRKKIDTKYFKLRQLESCLRKLDLEKFAEILNEPEVQEEIFNNPKYVYCNGEYLLNQRKYEEAIVFLKDFLMKKGLEDVKKSENLKTLNTLGKALCLTGKYEEANALFVKLAEKSPKNLNHKVSSGDAFLGMNDIDSANEKYQEVLKEDSEHNGGLQGAAKIEVTKGNFEAASELFKKISGPFESITLTSFFNNRGVSLVKTGDIDAAIMFYENSLQFNQKFKGLIYFNLGLAFYRKNLKDKAKDFFSLSLKTKEGENLVNKSIIKMIYAESEVTLENTTFQKNINN